MKIYKSGIVALLVVIIILILAIAATVVVVLLNNAEETFEQQMLKYQEIYSGYLTSEKNKNDNFDENDIDTKFGDSLFDTIFGNNILDEHKQQLEIINGKLIYNATSDKENLILEKLGMIYVRATIPEDIEIGDIITYVPTANPTGKYNNVIYARDTDTDNVTYNRFIEKEKTYIPGVQTWVYMGQDENGNAMITSRNVTTFEVYIGGGKGYITGPQRLDELCNMLYGNETYGKGRNMKIEDVNRILNYDGPLGMYFDSKGDIKTSDNPVTFGEIQETLKVKVNNNAVPENSQITFDEYLANICLYDGLQYTKEDTEEYKIVASNGNYWLSSQFATISIKHNLGAYGVSCITNGTTDGGILLSSDLVEIGYSFAIRPVIVLHPNIQITKIGYDWVLEVL